MIFLRGSLRFASQIACGRVAAYDLAVIIAVGRGIFWKALAREATVARHIDWYYHRKG